MNLAQRPHSTAWVQLDPVDEPMVLRGSVLTGSLDVAVVQSDERSTVILFDDGESERPGEDEEWIPVVAAAGLVVIGRDKRTRIDGRRSRIGGMPGDGR